MVEAQAGRMPCEQLRYLPSSILQAMARSNAAPIRCKLPRTRFRRTEFASHLRVVEGVGYSIGHYFEFLSSRDRVVARQQIVSNRRQVAVKEKELYFALGV